LVINNGFNQGEKIIKITPAIDCKLFSNNTTSQPTLQLKITTIARLHWKKGLEYTLEALALFKQKGILFHYTIVGDGIEKERLQFAIHQLGLVNEVTFAGKLAPEEVKKTLQNTDIYLQYSIQEGFCNAVLEAQAMGKLCIVSDAEGLTENVIDNVTGFVVPKRNPISLAEKIFNVSKMDSLEKEKMTQKALERIEKEFTIEKQLKEFIRFYNL
jgi:glycosyltransferase involved in cell wall biosynthesis